MIYDAFLTFYTSIFPSAIVTQFEPLFIGISIISVFMLLYYIVIMLKKVFRLWKKHSFKKTSYFIFIKLSFSSSLH